MTVVRHVVQTLDLDGEEVLHSTCQSGGDRRDRAGEAHGQPGGAGDFVSIGKRRGYVFRRSQGPEVRVVDKARERQAAGGLDLAQNLTAS